ncbi:hypothetical protein QUB36_13515 [Microcoleus sp. AT8-B1]|uniref:hypothetical protein n=1 Tax=unclassified Microcoleus TaxID=2642155 RepID=UPI002FD3B768
MVKASAITQADIKKVIGKQVKDDVRQYRRELALQRINLNKVIGVGNLENYIDEWEVDFANSTTTPKTPEPKNKKLKKITSTKRNPKL